jgi:hypothetical protein
MKALQWFYSSFTVNAANAGEQRCTQIGLYKRIPGQPRTLANTSKETLNL